MSQDYLDAIAVKRLHWIGGGATCPIPIRWWALGWHLTERTPR